MLVTVVSERTPVVPPKSTFTYPWRVDLDCSLYPYPEGEPPPTGAGFPSYCTPRATGGGRPPAGGFEVRRVRVRAYAIRPYLRWRA